jgi:CheY-like chemotaxis protein
MESLGGNCGVKDRSDGKTGSCFWFSVPFKPDETVEENRDTKSGMSNNHLMSSLRIIDNDNSSQDTKEDDNSEAKLRILLVDDSIMIRKTTSRSLCKEGYYVEVAQNGAECLKVLESTRLAEGSPYYAFDMILMDLQMPVMDGLEATRRIRAMEQNMFTSESEGGDLCPHITIIGITANTAGEARADCMESGMDGFIEKPLQVKKFRKYVSTIKLDLD